MINISEIIDKMIVEIPGNRELQVSLGIISPEENPFEKFQAIEWDDTNYRDNLCELALFVADIGIAKTGDDDTHEKSLLSEMIAVVSRRLVLRQIVSRKVVIGNIPNDLFALYARIAEEGWATRISEIAHNLKCISDRRIVETEKLSRLFGS